MSGAVKIRRKGELVDELQGGEVMEKCVLCLKNFPFEQGRYEGSHIEKYQAMICAECLSANWDGLANEEKIKRLRAHLEERGIPFPKANAKGWIPLS